MCLCDIDSDYWVGHRGLYKLGILHRDVSLQNILLGKDDAPVGWRGVLIDLDMAVWHAFLANVGEQAAITQADYRTVSVNWSSHIVG